MICTICGNPAHIGIGDNEWYCTAHSLRNSSPCSGCAARNAKIAVLAAKCERLREACAELLEELGDCYESGAPEFTAEKMDRAEAALAADAEGRP